MEASGCAVFTKSTKFDPFAAVGMVSVRVTSLLHGFRQWVFIRTPNTNSCPGVRNSYIRSNGQGIWRRKGRIWQLSWRLWIWREGCPRWILPDKVHRHHNHTHVDYLKIDVEGFEWNFFSTVDWNCTNVGQILIEVHPWNEEGKRRAVWQPTAGYIDSTFTKLEEAGYHLISLEPTTKTNVGQVELVFMNINWQPSGNWWEWGESFGAYRYKTCIQQNKK